MSAVWSDQAEKRDAGRGEPLVDWSTIRCVNRVINRRISGSEERDWLAWIRDEFVPAPLKLGLSIGCGTGLIERGALEAGLCDAIEGVDIAQGALEVARRLAGGMPVEYRRLDLETESLGRDAYDIVFSSATLHHVNNLEACLERLHLALRDGGLLAICEYTGPSRFQWGPDQLKLVSEVYSLLPWRYRYNHQTTGTMPRSLRPEVRAMVAGDPSEAVRSADLRGVIERYFRRVGGRRIGGTILNPLLAGVADNFDESDESDLAFLLLAAELEEQMIEAGAIRSDFVVEVYEKRPRSEVPSASDVARAATVAEQEREIERLLAEFAAIERSNEETAGRIEGWRREAGEIGWDVSRMQESNARLKNGPIFRIAGLLRRRGRDEDDRPSVSRPDDTTEAPHPVPVANPVVPVSMLEELSAPTTEVRAVRRYIDSVGRGSEVFWVRWLAELTGFSAKRALSIGLEPAVVATAARAGIFDEADISRLVEGGGGCALQTAWPGTGQPPDSYEMVLLDIDGCGVPAPEALAAAAEAVSDGGFLVAIVPGRPSAGAERARLEMLLRLLPGSEPGAASERAEARPEQGPAEPPEQALDSLRERGFLPFAERGFGAAAAGGADWIAGRVAASMMDRAVACLAVYAEGRLIEAGALAPGFRVLVYRKSLPAGGGSSGRERGRTPGREQDIVLLQKAEIEWLRGKISGAVERGGLLAAELLNQHLILQGAQRDLERLAQEREALERRGPARYLGLLRARAVKGRRGERTGGGR